SIALCSFTSSSRGRVPGAWTLRGTAREQEIEMSQYPIAVMVGSLRRDSFNRKLAAALAKLAPPEFSFSQLQIGDLPLYNQDDDASPAESVKRLKREITGSRGLLFVTAEYNRSIPG